MNWVEFGSGAEREGLERVVAEEEVVELSDALPWQWSDQRSREMAGPGRTSKKRSGALATVET